MQQNKKNAKLRRTVPYLQASMIQYINALPLLYSAIFQTILRLKALYMYITTSRILRSEPIGE